MPNVTDVVPFLWVTDMAASLRFYVDGVGFTRTRQWVNEGKLEWCWLELGGASLMLQEVKQALADKLGAGMTLNFICQDALAIYRELKTRGLNAERPFVGNGMWVTGLTDPDGYRLFFESLTDAEEESVYDGD